MNKTEITYGVYKDYNVIESKILTMSGEDIIGVPIFNNSIAKNLFTILAIYNNYKWQSKILNEEFNIDDKNKRFY